MKRAIVLACAVGLLMFTALPGGDAAAEVKTVKQDGTGDYTTISAALASVNTEFLVFPGVYQENVNIARSGITLSSYEGPNLTVIDGRKNTSVSAVTVPAGVRNFKLVGFRVTKGDHGIYVGDTASAVIANCVLEGNARDGVHVIGGESSPVTSAHIQNCVAVSNAGSGIYVEGTVNVYDWALPYCQIQNCIVTSNSTYGLSANTTARGERVIVNYDCIYMNATNYDTHFGTSGILLREGMIIGNTDAENPKFLGRYANDVRLQSTSPCVDTGSTDLGSNDPDGTRNDMGAFGGPDAATFYESPTDGPIVREVVVTPGSVPRGGNFSIEATVAVR